MADRFVQFLRVAVELFCLHCGGVCCGLGLHVLVWDPVELDEVRFVCFVDSLIGVDAEFLHCVIGCWDPVW